MIDAPLLPLALAHDPADGLRMSELVDIGLVNRSPSVRFHISDGFREANLYLGLEDAEQAYYALQSALKEAGVLSPDPRHGLVVSGLGSQYIKLSNKGEHPVRVTLANGKDLDIAPREEVPVVGGYLASVTIREAP